MPDKLPDDHAKTSADDLAHVPNCYQIATRQLESVIQANKLHIATSRILQNCHAKHIEDSEHNINRIRDRINTRIRKLDPNEMERALIAAYEDKINAVNHAEEQISAVEPILQGSSQWLEQNQKRHRAAFMGILIDLEMLAATSATLRKFNSDMNENHTPAKPRR